MASKAQKLFPALKCLTSTEEKVRKFDISTEEMAIIDAIIGFLGKFEKATEILSSSNKSSIAETEIIYRGLFSHLTQYESDPNIGEISKKMKEKLIQVYFPLIL